jgi:hypothetical protein
VWSRNSIKQPSYDEDFEHAPRHAGNATAASKTRRVHTARTCRGVALPYVAGWTLIITGSSIAGRLSARERAQRAVRWIERPAKLAHADLATGIERRCAARSGFARKT